MTTIKTLQTRLDALDDDFMIFAGSPLPTKAQITALEKKVGVPLRADHRAVMEKLGACAVLADEKVWPRPVEYDVRPLWQFYFGVELFGYAPPSAPDLDVSVQSAKRKPAGKKPFVAAMKQIGDRSCVGYDTTGKLFSWEPGGKPTAMVESGLFEVFMGWLRTLEADKERIKAEAKPTAKKATAKATPKTKTAETWLAELLDESGEQDEVAAALMKESPALRKKVIDGVVAAVDEDADDPLFCLAYLEKDSRAVDALVSFATQTKKKGVRLTALTALGALETTPKRVLPVLVRALGDADESVISVAAHALEDYADSSTIAPLEKALVKIQKNKRWIYGVAAGYVYEALAGAAKRGNAKDQAAAVAIITKNLTPPERYAALPAFEALIALGPKAKTAIPVLEKAITGKDQYLTSLARHALGAITGDYKPHLAALEKAAKNKDKDGAIKSVAQGALRDAKARKNKN